MIIPRNLFCMCIFNDSVLLPPHAYIIYHISDPPMLQITIAMTIRYSFPMPLLNVPIVLPSLTSTHSALPMDRLAVISVAAAAAAAVDYHNHIVAAPVQSVGSFVEDLEEVVPLVGVVECTPGAYIAD